MGNRGEGTGNSSGDLRPLGVRQELKRLPRAHGDLFGERRHMKTTVASHGMGAETAGGLRNVLGGNWELRGGRSKGQVLPTVSGTARSTRWVLGPLVLCSSHCMRTPVCTRDTNPHQCTTPEAHWPVSCVPASPTARRWPSSHQGLTAP